MAADTFIRLDGIDGESTASGHEKWIELLSWSMGVSQPVSISGGASTASRSAGRCNHQDFSCVKMADSASPKLLLHACNGKHIPKVEIDVQKAAETQELLLKITLEDVMVTAVQGSGGSGGEPTESISLNYAKIKWEYNQLNHETGKKEGTIPAHWDLMTNTGG